MSETLEIRGSQYRVKIRNPLAVALLSFVTLGIYHVVWWYKINRELCDFGEARDRDLGHSPALSTLALFPGFIVLIPPLVTAWRGTGRVKQATRMAGREPLIGWVALILYIFIGIGWIAYLQSELNKVWHTEAIALPGQASVPALDEGMSAPAPAEPERTVSPAESPNLEPPGSSQP
jgi:hypothetical protein